MADRHDRFLVATVAFHAVTASLQRGALLVNGAQRRLNQGRAQSRQSRPRNDPTGVKVRKVRAITATEGL